MLSLQSKAKDACYFLNRPPSLPLLRTPLLRLLLSILRPQLGNGLLQLVDHPVCVSELARKLVDGRNVLAALRLHLFLRMNVLAVFVLLLQDGLRVAAVEDLVELAYFFLIAVKLQLLITYLSAQPTVGLTYSLVLLQQRYPLLAQLLSLQLAHLASLLQLFRFALENTDLSSEFFGLLSQRLLLIVLFKLQSLYSLVLLFDLILQLLLFLCTFCHCLSVPYFLLPQRLALLQRTALHL